MEHTDLSLKLALLGAGAWTRWPPEVSSNLKYLMIQWISVWMMVWFFFF